MDQGACRRGVLMAATQATVSYLRFGSNLARSGIEVLESTRWDRMSFWTDWSAGSSSGGTQ